MAMVRRSAWFREDALFEDRRDAGRKLARSLTGLRDRDVLVLGIPRGGVVVADELAKAIAADLDVIVARKLGAPGSPELAIGAVTANGGRFLNEEILSELGVSDAYLEGVTAEQRAEARRREHLFRGAGTAAEIRGRTVVLVDDGLATGATMRAAIRSVRKHEPAKLIVAVPVGAAASCETLRAEADELVCPHELLDFGAVGFFYRHFEPTEDEEVKEVLAAHAERHRHTAAQAAS
jgi:predicted phosphoribosyltransferase